MPTRTKDYPIYTYDEPAVYKDFSGGINTDPSNEHLLENEMRDCVNMHYLSGALVKRKGAKKLCDISCDDDLVNIQGIFLFTYRITYIIIAADGKLYQGIYNDEATIKLSRLFIVRTKANQNFIFDEEDAFAGLEEKQPSQIVGHTNHEGYIQTFFKNTATQKEYAKNERGQYSNVISGAVKIGDVFTEPGLIEKKYLCIKEFEKKYDYPDDFIHWEYADAKTIAGEYYYGTGDIFEYVVDGITHTLTAEDIQSDEDLNQYNEYGLRAFDIRNNRNWSTQDYVFYNGKFYHCKSPHMNFYDVLDNHEYFVDISIISTTSFVQNIYMLFQNYRKVEAATINNKMYIATGTRIIEIYLSNNELRAQPVSPYLCNYTELTKIGYNYLSPYPELAVASQNDTVTTSITGIKVNKTKGGRFLLTPVMNIQVGDSLSNYYYKWEKFVKGRWYTIIPFISQMSYLPGEDSALPIEKKDYSSIEVDDADKYAYRCTFAKSFELDTAVVAEWDSTKEYSKGQFASEGAHVYRCIKSYSPDNYIFKDNEFSLFAYKVLTRDPETGDVLTTEEDPTQLWEEEFQIKIYPYLYSQVGENNELVDVYSTIADLVVDEANGEYFGSATSVIFNNDLTINDNFLLIHSCTKVIADGNKLLFYADRFNSGQWFKTIINNPSYITDRGSLSFKTNKNESVVKVIPFQGNILVFANADNVGGSIHLVSGNGDDYDDESGYYSPYQRKTINASITASNPDSIQICDNIIVFKYFNRVYYINASDLNNDSVKVTPCNDRILNNEGKVKIPWDDDTCISEVTNTYYALIWKEKYIINEDGELELVHPGLRVKMYYKMATQVQDNSYVMPWLRDESEVFNTEHILYVKGKPLFLYHNTLISFDEDYYKDINTPFKCVVHCRAVDLNYESFLKLIESCTISFHRNQFNKVDLNVIIKNEAGHILLDTKSKQYAANDLGVLKVGHKLDNTDNIHRIGSTIQDTKMFLTINKFPALLADTEITAITDESFTFSGVTYQYTSIDSPDSNPTEIYKNIIRPQED